MVVSPPGKEKNHRNDAGAYFRHGDGPPYAIDPEKERKNQDGGGLENQGPQKGNGSRNGAVIEGGKKRGSKNIKAGQQEGERKQLECMAGKVKKLFVISYKYPCEGISQ